MFLKARGLLPILNQGDDDDEGEGKIEKEEEEIEGMMEDIEEEEDVAGGDI